MISIDHTIAAIYNDDEGRQLNSSFVKLTHQNCKLICENFGREEIDLKIRRAALKALLLTPWREEITQEVRHCFSPLTPILSPLELSPRRVEELDRMFDNIQDLTRSRSGTGGIYYVSCKPTSRSRNRFVLKLVSQNEKNRFILADRLFTILGYPTPRTKCISESKSIRKKLGPSIEKNCAGLDPKKNPLKLYQMQLLKESLEHRNALLVMRLMEGASLEEIAEDRLLPLLQNPFFLQSLGEMIFIDAFIGNTDRMTLQHAILAMSWWMAIVSS